ncbi:hypothetical protein DOTSEDRAFT_30831 [Dothistroma septosporum NZE10]|uniref:Uncharacterized protein n=1 Tax=Dothistroma septosporum (strain NZE10 / CBS 128990) TaxID=675120 RepID=N1Q346_DOTSN|nr:hypothetical protein DOTSEDRAFT_30831 [Dothistroma septosporum NZE10]
MTFRTLQAAAVPSRSSGQTSAPAGPACRPVSALQGREQHELAILAIPRITGTPYSSMGWQTGRERVNTTHPATFILPDAVVRPAELTLPPASRSHHDKHPDHMYSIAELICWTHIHKIGKANKRSGVVEKIARDALQPRPEADM